MRVGSAHLTYCTNIHAGETWAEVRRDLERYTLAVKRRVCPDAPFGVGLRLSARAAAECDVDELRRFLDASGMYVFTLNGFPHGAFHATTVKQWVYRPDWREAARVDYTLRLADILAALLPDGVTGSISTVPICFSPVGKRVKAFDAFRDAAPNVERVVAHLRDLAARTGKHVVLAFEPEPSCVLETIRDVVVWHELRGADPHVGLCLDACHAAVEFEAPQIIVKLLRMAGVPIAKLQLSSALRVAPPDAAARAALAPYAESVYLHQTVARAAGGRLTRYDDLHEALADPAAHAAEEWRIHYHVPIFHADIAPFATTQPLLAELLAEHRRAPISTHLEVETYTWDVLPAALRDRPVDEAIAAELAWALERLA